MKRLQYHINPTPQDESSGHQNLSIRKKLEQDAWARHYSFASRLWILKNATAQEPGCAQPSREDSETGRYQQTERRRKLSWQDRSLLSLGIILLLLLLVRISTVQAEEIPAGGVNTDAWGLEFSNPTSHGQPQLSHSMALSTQITVDITGMVARIDVTQRFLNTGPAWAEAVYRFPLPGGAAVDELLITAGDRVIQGMVQEKQAARRRFQQARAEGMVAALVEQQRPNQFETRLVNIGPDEEISVSISFLTQIDYRNETYGLQIPLTFTPRSMDTSAASFNSSPSPVFLAEPAGDSHRLSMNIQLHSAMNIASLESRYHDMEIHPALGGYSLYLQDPDTRTDRIFELNWTPDFGQSPSSTLMTWDDGEAVYAMLMLAPPMLEALAPQDRELVFVIDTSGSMEGTSLQQARAALYQGLGHLRPGDRFNLVEFNSDSHLLFDQSVEPSDARLQEAMDFIDGLKANGGTNMAPALRDATNLPAQAGLLRQIVFITDGSVGNEEELLVQLADQLGDQRLFTVSIGSAPNTWFMNKAAVIGRGNHTHIGKLGEVEDRMNSLWQRIENPALQNIFVDWGMDAEYFPELIPDLYAGEPLWVYARLPAQPREITLHGELDGLAWQQESRPAPGMVSESLGALWARSKIESLEDSRMFGDDEELIRLQVTELALEFGLLTPYTSLVAVDQTPARPVGENIQSHEIASLLPAGSSSHALGFSATATGWKAQLAFSLATLLFAASLLWFCTPSRRLQPGGSPPPFVHVH